MSISGTEPKEASFWEVEGKAIRCQLCPHSCLIPVGRTGICRVRTNKGGRLYAMSYAKVSSIHLDPMEKKPLFHFKPGQPVLSFGGASCNLRCQHCQNFTIAQVGLGDLPLRTVPPREVPALCRANASEGVAWTYNEPTIWYEYVMDASRQCKEEGLFTVSVSNGYIQEGPLRQLKGVIDAMNIDVKGFTETFYETICNGQLAPVLGSCETAKEMGVHVELTYLIIPTKNDKPNEIEDFCQWVRDRMGVDTPVHFSRFHPDYKMEGIPSTPRSTIETAHAIAVSKGLEYVFIGNMPSEKGENTYCPDCGQVLVRRSGYSVEVTNVVGGKCARCGRGADIVW